MHRFFLILVLLTSLVACKNVRVLTKTKADIPSENIPTPILELGQEKLSDSDLDAYFNAYTVSDSLQSDSVLYDLINRKRYYLDAISKGYRADQTQQDELQTYRRILAKSFIIDTAMVNNLARLTYTRMQKEVHAAHLLLAIPPDASPADTSRVMDKIKYLRSEIEKGAAFDSLATIYSADVNTKESGGDMGWFSALNLLFPLENAAYKTPVGQVSQPVRTEAGYHLVKVCETRPSLGKVEVAHILKVVPQGASPAFEIRQKQKIDSLHQILEQNPSSFESLCQENSDDSYSKETGGKLPSFSIGSWAEKSFEQASFALKAGEISEPIRTQAGWHIIKMIKRDEVPPFKEIEEMIVNKVKTDSRGEYLEHEGYSRFYDEIDLKVEHKDAEKTFALASDKIKTRNWKPNLNALKTEKLLEINGKAFSNLDFLRYAEDKQTFEKQFPNYTPDMYLRRYFKDYVKSNAQEAIVEGLGQWNPQFSNFIKAYEEGLLISLYLNDMVYEKSVGDTLGQRSYYETHPDLYLWPRKAKATILKSKSDTLFKAYEEIVNSGMPYRLKRGILPFYYKKNEFQLDDELKRKLTGLLLIMAKNPGYIVEIGGNRDLNEEVEVSRKRIGQIVKFLVDSGLEITRITEYDYGTDKLADLFDWPQNQRVSFQFFTKDKNDIGKILHSEENGFEMAHGYYHDGQNEFIEQTDWKPGTYNLKKDDFYYQVRIEEVLPVSRKTIKEARGEVIKDYQNLLLKNLNADLKAKYPMVIDKEAFDKAFEAYKNENN
ncbi:peptidylprolyl isomerase [Marinilongibacter aquaticus]|uniref:peptidylprolyl isomerase n=1 Tax=Marinilongibacter aquaticus TaxID=2975157 RepID=UPI0021BCFD72|nr:peptidylprolyl isomerase [Marinilongibacter aquaticus]UBM59771.1 peptidylprolyl isomerase [Marinilongibacter aquaticus]